MTYYFEKPEKLVDFDARRHAILEASAGTGKTFTLENLVLHLLLEERIAIDQILVVTFTRRATAELQEKVRLKISEVLNLEENKQIQEIPAGKTAKNYWKIDDETRALLQAQLNQFDRAQIFTIHSFCQNILTGHAFANHQLFSGELTDGDRLFEETYYEILRTVYARDPELSRWLDAWFGIDGDKTVGNLFEALQKVVRSRYPLKPAMDEQDFEAILELVKSGKAVPGHRLKTAVLHKFKDAIEAELKRKKLVEGMFSFDDMLQLVHDSLYCDDPVRREALVAALRARYKYALVDEFQDTDQVQWEIFRRVFVESANQNILCAIGDPKQAIYGFRGADVDTYFRAIAELEEAGALTIQLDKNFRSTPKMIAAYNHIFDAGKDFFTGPNRYPNPVGAGKGEDGVTRPAAIEIMQIETDKAIKSGPMKLSFAEEIAARIGELLSDESKKISAKDIYVLTRSRGESALIGKTLRRHHIPYSFYREEGLFQTDEARHIGEVLAAVCRPEDRSRRLRAYLTPFFGIPLELVDAYDNLEPSGSGERTPRERLMAWNRLGSTRRFRELFQELVQGSGLIRRELVVGAGERGLTNYQHLFEILMRQTAEMPGTLDDLTGWFLRLTDETDLPELEDGSLQRLETENDAVQVMTIHKSKGLQAEVVFVLGGLGRNYQGPHTYVEPGQEENPRPKNMCLSREAFEGKSVSDTVQKGINAFYREEGERLMYVALTRAKRLMVLPYALPEANECKGDYLPVMNRLHEIVKEVNAGVADPEMFAIRKCPVKSSVEFQPALEAADLASWELPELVDLGGAAEFEQFERLRQRRITLASYSSLSHHGGKSKPSEADQDGEDEDLDLAGIADNIEKTALGDSKISGMKGGDLIHDLLEFVDFEVVANAVSFESWSALATTKELVETTCKKHGFRVEEVGQEALLMVFNALTTAVGFPGGGALQLAKLKRYVREMRFVFPIPEAGSAAGDEVVEVTRGFAHGFIDISFEHEGKTYFADWKSDRLPGGEFGQAALAQRVKEKYPAQAIIYTMATLRMLGIRNEQEFNKKFGGFFYFFARGMTGTDSQEGVHFESVSWGDVVKLERLLREPDPKNEWKKILQGGFDELHKNDVPVEIKTAAQPETV